MTLSAEAEASNGAAMTAGPNSGVNQNTDYVTMSPRLDLRVNFVKTGIHHIWIRGRLPAPTQGRTTLATSAWMASAFGFWISTRRRGCG